MTHKRMCRLITSAAAVSLILAGSPALGQPAVDAAHGAVTTLLEGAGDVLVWKRGQIYEGGYSLISDVRRESKCVTIYNSQNPSDAILPAGHRGVFNKDLGVSYAKAMNIRAEGDRVFYDYPREATGKNFTYHYKLSTPAAAAELASAFMVLQAACQGVDAPSDPVEEVVLDSLGNVAALAIDRRNGSRYGWAIDYPGREEADARALSECRRDGSTCHIVLRFTGGCGAYAADFAAGSTAYGWGTAQARAAAEQRSHDEARARGATNVTTRVWGCNSVKPGSPTAASASPPAPAKDSARLAREEAAEQIRVADLNAKADARLQAIAAKERQEKSEYEQKIMEHEQRLRQAKADQEQFARDRAKYEADMAAVRAAQAEYQRKLEEHQRLLASGKYQRPQ